MNHFKLTSESKVNVFGVTLFRIELTVDCKWGKIGDKGGWIESENLSNGNARVSGDAWVSGNAQVYGNARVYGNAQVSGNAQVYGDAWVSGNAQVYGDARVYGNAQVSGNAQVYGNAWVSGNAQVYGDAWVYGNAQVYGNAWVYGNAQVYGDTWEKSPLQIQGSKHFFTVSSLTKISIGCHLLTFEDWKERYKEIGLNEGYSGDEISEYGLYIELAFKIYRNI